MRHDAKLGLALGMLVVGFAVAFCFPRQPERAEFPDDQADLIVEQELEFLPIRAYQPPSREDQVQESRALAGVTSAPDDLTHSVPGETSKSPPPAPLAPLAKNDSPRNEEEERVLTAVKPTTTIAESTTPQTRESPVWEKALQEPTKVAATSPPAARTIAPIEDVPARVAAAVETPSVAANEPEAEAPVASQPETYRVQPGDTLSDIAVRYLGGASKYQALFEANRDQLSSPDKLPVGIVLTLPSENPQQQIAPEMPRTMIAEQESQQQSQDADSTAKRVIAEAERPERSDQPIPPGKQNPTDIAGHISPPPYYAIEARSADEASRRQRK